MKILKAIAILTLVVAIPLMGYAQSDYKVKERSSRKAPKWYGGMEQGYIITQSIADDLESAKRGCLDDVKKMIIDAVAQNVKSSSETNLSQEVANNKITGFLDEFKYSFKTESANVPYINSISYSNVEDYYWEQRVYKKTDAVKYLYTIKYPFSSLELKKLVSAFNEQDKMMEDKLVAAEALYSNLTSIEHIGSTLSTLKALENYFFDDVRSSRVKTLQSNYNAIYPSLSIKRVSDELGRESFAILYGDRTLSSSKPPKVGAKTVYEVERIKEDSLWVVTYNYSTCDPSEMNYLDISWNIGGHIIKERFNINLDGNKPSIKAVGTVSLNITSDDSTSSVKLSMNIESFNNEQFKIESVKIGSKEFTSDIVFNNIDYTSNSQGVHSFSSQSSDNVSLSTNKGLKAAIVKGTVTYTSDKGRQTIQFTLPLNKNW